MSKPKIVILDGHTANPGDLSWEPLAMYGELTIYPRTGPHELLDRAEGAAILLTNKVVIDRATMARLPKLRYIGVLATGYNVVDVAAARERGIAVTNVPAYSTASVAQLTFALLLELTHRVGEHAQGVRAGRWTRSLDFAYWDGPLVELEELTLGLIGHGHIGQAVGRIGEAFGMQVQVHRRSGGMPLEHVLRTSDVVSLHCPLTDQNRHLINAERLAWMKPTAFLINTSRGPLVNEADLAAALDAERLAGAAVDVLSSEPPPADNPLLSARNCLVTPHLAWATKAARQRLLQTAINNVRAFLGGTPRNVVNA